jgi:subtilisin family serine protease/subtilisin-like proprotein convertase family protein
MSRLGPPRRPLRALPPTGRARLRVEGLEDRTVPAGPFGPTLAPQGAYDPSRILALFRADVTVPDGSAILPGTEIGSPIALVPGLRVVSLDAGVTVKQALAAYKASPLVLRAGPDYQVRLTATPNDPLFGSLWGIHNTGQTGGRPDADVDGPEAWDVVTSGPLVAVLDTGVDYNHPDLAANVWTNPGEVEADGLDNDGNGFVDDYYGYDFVNNDADPMDDYGHGTHVAGTIAAVGNNGIGVAGVGWDTKVMALKFMNVLGFGLESDAIRALDYAVAQGATISNNSWGGIGVPDPFLYLAIQNAGAAGHIFVAAAGNDSLDTDLVPGYPAGFDLDNIVSVAATDHNDDLAWFSNFGATTVDLAAPGDNIVSTVPAGGQPLSDPSGYIAASGTSMASPHAAGVVALVRGQHPDWTYRQVIERVLGTVDRVPSLEGKTVTGGRLNAARAVGSVSGPVVTGPYVVASSPDGETPGPVGSARVTFNQPVNPATFTRADVTLTGPGGKGVTVRGVTAVAGSDNRQFDITFKQQTAVGTYRLGVGPLIADPGGTRMDQDRDGIAGERPQDRYTSAFALVRARTFASSDVPKPIHDFVPTTSTLTITDDITIADLNVRIDLAHWWVADLRIKLVSPSGREVVLSAFNGGSGDDYGGTTFDDEATTRIQDGSAPFSGSYRPQEPLAAFDNETARGTWQLVVEDQGLLADGTLKAWSLTIQPTSGA